ncbi:MAG: alpha-amylase family glycosyl hydrolase [Polyangiales bacterium]
MTLRRVLSSLVVSSALSACAVDNAALLDGGADVPELDIARSDIPIQGPTCPDDVRLPDGACDGARLPDGALVDAPWGDDAPQPPPPPPCNEVRFTYRNADARTVWLSGTFTRWAATPAAGALEMSRGADGAWTVTTTITPVGPHQYKFIVNGTDWVRDPENPETESDGNGGLNSVIRVCGGGAASCGEASAFDWRDSVMYFAMIDRFADGDGMSSPVPNASGGDPRTGASAQFAGGDLRGLTSRMPYLADLGVTALWLSAPYKNRDTAGAAVDPAMDTHQYSAFHGYWPSPDNIDWTNPAMPSPTPRVEPRIGTDTDLRAAISAAHMATSANGHGIRVLFDYVMKHVDTESGLYRAHNDWFARGSNGQFRLCGPENLWDDAVWGTRCAFTSYLAPIDHDNAAARAWSVNDAVWWARTYGVDGLRLDAIKHVPLSWLTELRARLNREFTSPMGGRFYLVGETFNYEDRALLRSFVNPQTMLDGQFDFPWRARLCDAVFTPGGRLDAFASWVGENERFYGAGALMSTWVGNHDIPRAIHYASRQITECRAGSSPQNGWTRDFTQPTDAAPYERLGVAFAVLLTSPGLPLIYYGDEVGLAGGGDPDNRRMMPWEDGALNAHQRALRSAVRTLARIRGANPSLGRGARTTLSASQDTWVYRMGGCGVGAPDVVVAINRGDAAQSVDIPMGSYRDLATERDTMGGRTELPPRSWRVLSAR